MIYVEAEQTNINTKILRSSTFWHEVGFYLLLDEHHFSARPI